MADDKKRFTAEEIELAVKVCGSKKIGGSGCFGCPLRGISRCVNRLFDALAEENKRLREEQRWIPVEERLPDKELDGIAAVVNTEAHYPGFMCLVMIRDAEYPTILNYADIDGDRVWVDDECNWYPVTHWKPMPKGPEVGHE